MKTYFKLLVGAAVVLAVSAIKVSAQDSKFGSDPEECKKQYSYLRFANEAKEYDECMTYWRNIMKICPAYSYNVYIWGVNAITDHIEKAASPEEKGKYVDTLMMCYDLWLHHFPVGSGKNVRTPEQTAYAKAAALMNYAPDRHTQILTEIGKYIEIKKDDDDFDASMLTQAFQQAKFMYEKKQKTADELMDAYDRSMNLVSDLIKKNGEKPELVEARANIEGMFITIEELSSCENLVSVFEPKFKANPNDVETLKRIVYTLQARKCQETQLFSDAAEALYKIDPNTDAALALVTLFILKGENEKAVEYLKKAIDVTTDNEEKAKLEVQLATLYMNEFNNTSQALHYAKQAISHNPNNGHAYFIIGSAYGKLASGASQCSEIDSRGVYWVIVDTYSKAKQADPSLADDANKMINQYSQHFPSKEDIFMNGLTEGSSYTVNCNGIYGVTTIRARK